MWVTIANWSYICGHIWIVLWVSRSNESTNMTHGLSTLIQSNHNFYSKLYLMIATMIHHQRHKFGPNVAP